MKKETVCVIFAPKQIGLAVIIYVIADTHQMQNHVRNNIETILAVVA